MSACAPSSPTVLVVGASRGIGLELARQYTTEGWQVHATTRTPASPGALGNLTGALTLHSLDVIDPDQISHLKTHMANTAIDVLIHNAGVYGTGMSRDAVMAVNAVAPIVIAETLMDAVARSQQKKVLLMTSQMGARRGSKRSLGLYGDSKAALNDAFRERASDWARRGVTAIVMHPGWVRTDMGGTGAGLLPRESALGIRTQLAKLDRAQHGRFLTWDGREHPW